MASDALILLVDDYVDALEMYREHLNFRGYRVVTADSGQAAIDAARAECPSIILMDLRMPDMTGVQAMQLLRSDTTFSGVPIVAFTAYALSDERLEALHQGFDAVISKPCLPDDLITTVEGLLTGERATQE